MPTFKLKSDGREYSTERPNEVTRLRLSRAYEEVGVDPVPVLRDTQFHPADHTITEVQKHLEEHPEDRERVLAEEKASAKPRVTLTEGS